MVRGPAIATFTSATSSRITPRSPAIIQPVGREKPRLGCRTLNAPLFEGVKGMNALVRGTWGAKPAAGLEPKRGDFVVEKMRMSGWQDTNLETLLLGLGVDTVVVSGAWTNMSIEHTARTGADKGYFMVVPEDGCSTMNADWHNASINYALQNVSTVTDCKSVAAALGA